MSTLTLAIIWVISSVLLALGVGYYLGRSQTAHHRKLTMKALQTLLQSTAQLTEDVDTHNLELEDAERTVGELRVSGELEQVQRALLRQIAGVLDANRKLENDLTCTRYTLERQAQELDRTRKEARTDELSGVHNRKAFDETLNFWFSDSKRNGGAFSLVLADIDHFKWINDTHGHGAGDRVVAHIGGVLNRCIHEDDFVARYGGDEFAMLLRNREEETAVEAAERIRATIEQQIFNVGKHGERAAVTFSMGLSTLTTGDTLQNLFERADQALYRSKQSGRNKLHCEKPQAELAASY